MKEEKKIIENLIKKLQQKIENKNIIFYLKKTIIEINKLENKIKNKKEQRKEEEEEEKRKFIFQNMKKETFEKSIEEIEYLIEQEQGKLR